MDFLLKGTMLNGKYKIVSYMAESDFSNIYLAENNLGEKVAGNEKNQNKKNFNVNNKSFKKDQNLKNNKLSQLDKEIERNWKILGRDRNGNNLKKI